MKGTLPRSSYLSYRYLETRMSAMSPTARVKSYTFWIISFLKHFIFFVSACMSLTRHSLFEPWCFHKPSWTEPVEALDSICCKPTGWLIPEFCWEGGGGKDRWLLTHLYECVSLWLRKYAFGWCKCMDVYMNVCVPVQALAFNGAFGRWYNILFCEKWKAVNLSLHSGEG